MTTDYQPERVWQEPREQGGTFGSINRPTAGARQSQTLPTGTHPLQLYSLGTPNGVKVTIMLEELLALGEAGSEYDAFLIDIGNGDQFGSDFVAINPNSKIPALLDRSFDPPLALFESGSILLHLAEKFGHFLPKDPAQKAETLNWLFWQMGSAPYLGGGFGHFYAYAPEKLQYPIDRFAMETKRQLDVLNKLLATRTYIAGEFYSIADMAIFPWYGALVKGKLYNAGQFLSVDTYTHIIAWADRLLAREPVRKGRLVNRTWGDQDQQLKERHQASDFDKLNLDFK